MEKMLKMAREAGFDHAAALAVDTLQPREAVRAMCAADRCGAYGKNWSCPPHGGTLEQCAERLRACRSGVLVQSVGALESSFDWDAMRALEALHTERFLALAERLRRMTPGALCLGAGGCRVCRRCAFPEPCRCPDRACGSMEGYGLLVSEVCRRNGLPYYYGAGTLAYSACFLLP